MSVEVRIPTILRTYTRGEKAVHGNGATLQKDLRSLNVGVPYWVAIEAFNETGVSKLASHMRCDSTCARRCYAPARCTGSKLVPGWAAQPVRLRLILQCGAM